MAVKQVVVLATEYGKKYKRPIVASDLSTDNDGNTFLTVNLECFGIEGILHLHIIEDDDNPNHQKEIHYD